MKAFAVAVIAAVSLALVAAFVFTTNQQFAYEAFATSGARVSDPGKNLVGPKWNGEADDGSEDSRGHGTESHPKRS